MKKYEITPQRLFVSIMIILGAFGIFWVCYTRGACINFVLTDASFYFMDFFNHVFYVQTPQNVYHVNYNACFPPLAYMFYWLVAQMLPENTVIMDDSSSLSSYAILLFIVYNIILGILFYDSVRKFLESKGGEQQFTADVIVEYIKCFCFYSCMERKCCSRCRHLITPGFGTERT